MSTHIITALRQQTQLRGNTFLIATELAHRMNSRGSVRIAYQYLALKAHCSSRTAIRQVQRLIKMGLFQKQVTRTYYGCDRNTYTYTGPWPASFGPPEAERLRALRAMPYQVYLQTPEWQAMRIQALHAAYHRCQVCNTRDECLDVHHRDYSNLGEEWLRQLIVLCRSCHTLFHKAGKLAPGAGRLVERPKELSLTQDIRRHKKALAHLTRGSEQWKKTVEEIARLEALLQQ